MYKVLFVFFLLLTLSAPSIASADTVDDLKAQIEAHNKKISEIDAEIALYQKQLNVIGAEKQTLQSAIKQLDISRSQTQSQINATNNKISSANLKLKELSLEIGDTENSIGKSRASLAKSLRDRATADDVSLIERILAAEDFTDAWTVLDQAQTIGEALRNHAESLRVVKATLATQHQTVDKTKKELSAHTVELSTQKKTLDVNKQSKQTLLTETQSQEAAYQQLIAQKRAEQSTFESALFKIASELQYIVDPSSVPSAGSGVLRWPLDDVYITQQFGRTSDSGRLYSSGTHDGIDFRAPTGTAVKAALAGNVYQINQGAAPNCQYGKWVLVKHANGLATLYAHLSSIGVSQGEAVTSGQVIGNSGMTGYATGPHLHFTVYLGDAISLKQYTCKSGAVVTVPIAPPNAYLNPMSYL